MEVEFPLPPFPPSPIQMELEPEKSTRPQDICDILDRELSDVVSRIEQEPGEYGALASDLKTALYNRHHLCAGPGDQLAKFIPPPPHELPREIEKVVKAVTG